MNAREHQDQQHADQDDHVGGIKHQFSRSVLAGGLHRQLTPQGMLEVLQNQNEYTISEKNIKDGFMKVIQNTGLLGRWQQVNSIPKVICDTAHNKHGLTIVINQIKKEKYENLHIVLGVVNDKDLDDILPLFPKNATYYFCKPNISRGLNENLLKEKALTFELIGKVFLSVSEAYKNALKNASPNDFIYIGGSTFVVAEIL